MAIASINSINNMTTIIVLLLIIMTSNSSSSSSSNSSSCSRHVIAPASANKNAPPEKKTRGKISSRRTKSEGGEHFLLLDCTAEARAKETCFFTDAVSTSTRVRAAESDARAAARMS